MDTEETLLIKNISDMLQIELGGNTFELFRNRLIELVDYLIHNNTDKLTWILYRIDVNEEYLKRELLENNEHGASIIIADLIIERELQKINKGDMRNTDNWSFDL